MHMHSISPREAERRADQSRQSKRVRTKDAANYCNCSESYLNKLRSIGGGPVFIKRGRLVVYDTSDLDAWLDAGRRTSTSDTGEEA
jgi:hypothetical protein